MIDRAVTAAPLRVGVPDPLRVRARRVPLAAAVLVPLVTLALMSVAPAPLGLHPAFLPSFITLVVACYTLTALLLGAQYRAGGSPRILVLSWAFVFSAATLVPRALVFPGMFSGAEAAGVAPSSAAWLWISWHLGLPLFIALSLVPWPARMYRYLDRSAHRTRRSVLSQLAVVVLAVVTATVVTGSASWLPVIVEDDAYTLLGLRLGIGVALVVLGAILAALVGVWRRGARGLELWALVALIASGSEVALTLMARERFTVGWYGARGLAFLAAFAVLGALLHEINELHERDRRSVAALAEQNAALREAQGLREHLLAVVSHDMRAPVAGLTGYLELLSEADLPPEQQQRMLERSQRLTRRLTLLIEDLLAAATADHTTLEVTPVPLRAQTQLEEAAGGFPERDVRITCEPGLEVVADPTRLQQVLDNLVANALKYGAEPVDLRACRVPGGGPGGDVQLEVADAGPGVPADFVPQLFQRYARVENHAVAGSGLGLSVVSDLVAAHGGTVSYDVERRAFVVRLPGQGVERAVEPAATPAAAPSPARGRGPSVDPEDHHAGDHVSDAEGDREADHGLTIAAPAGS